MDPTPGSLGRLDYSDHCPGISRIHLCISGDHNKVPISPTSILEALAEDEALMDLVGRGVVILKPSYAPLLGVEFWYICCQQLQYGVGLLWSENSSVGFDSSVVWHLWCYFMLRIRSWAARDVLYSVAYASTRLGKNLIAEYLKIICIHGPTRPEKSLAHSWLLQRLLLLLDCMPKKGHAIEAIEMFREKNSWILTIEAAPVTESMTDDR